MFTSPVFDRAITHRQELTTIMRQDKNEEEFMSCLKDVGLGRCTKPTFIKGLARHCVKKWRAMQDTSSLGRYQFSCLSNATRKN